MIIKKETHTEGDDYDDDDDVDDDDEGKKKAQTKSTTTTYIFFAFTSADCCVVFRAHISIGFIYHKCLIFLCVDLFVCVCSSFSSLSMFFIWSRLHSPHWTQFIFRFFFFQLLTNMFYDFFLRCFFIFFFFLSFSVRDRDPLTEAIIIGNEPFFFGVFPFNST